MQIDIKALAQTVDTEILRQTGVYAKAYMNRDAAYRARNRDEDEIARFASQADEAYSAIMALERVYENYGWTRAHIVPAGHVHRNRRCHTLFSDTVVHLVPQCSGLTEDEIVKLAGDRACTHCYPSAPLSALQQASKLFAPDEGVKAERKAERLTKAEEKKAKEVRVPTGPNSEEVYGTVRSAKTEAADRMWWALYSTVYTGGRNRDEHLKKFFALTSVITAHRDCEAANVDELEAELIEKARKKFVREGKKSAANWDMTPEQFVAKVDEAVAYITSL